VSRLYRYIQVFRRKNIMYCTIFVFGLVFSWIGYILSSCFLNFCVKGNHLPYMSPYTTNSYIIHCCFYAYIQRNRVCAWTKAVVTCLEFSDWSTWCSGSVHTDRRADMKKPRVALRNFANAPKNHKDFYRKLRHVFI